jgi:hypothetical protein
MKTTRFSSNVIIIGSQVHTMMVRDMTPCSPLKSQWTFRKNKPSKKHVASRVCLTVVSCLIYSSTPKIEEICSSEKSVNFNRSTRRHFPEDRTLQGYYFLGQHHLFKTKFRAVGFENSSAVVMQPCEGQESCDGLIPHPRPSSCINN